MAEEVCMFCGNVIVCDEGAWLLKYDWPRAHAVRGGCVNEWERDSAGFLQHAQWGNHAPGGVREENVG